MKYGEKSLRHELKYFINMHEYRYLKERLLGSLKRDQHGLIDDGYHIRSLYFDDVYNSAFNEKELGVFKRKKYRIRIYNITDQSIKLEKKSKYGMYINKDTINITKNEFYKLLEGKNEFLIQSNRRMLEEFYVEIKTKLLKPVVIVDYEREAYILEAGNVRITFDKNLSVGINSFDIFDKNIAMKTIFDKPIMIMEVKYDSFLPNHVRNLLQIDHHNISAASKYVMCKKMIDHYK
ncbi:polyphosphate polymerase domain-containing protein [Marinisporobacter balticus]|uniref:VTC domain-containing protein n=1 Tax=Marinisporobacter balticus TaxID=2018667 RepID=A0A4R2K8X4_9FIRM|nr:polyphosphate polymerase domain-containing protein [Marinisporobacter balticus]TCO69833.1 VTC domain-containing protein [Marinisporobacter balticus]